MTLAPLVSDPTETISALAAVIVQRHRACMELERDFDRLCGERDAWRRLDRTEEPTVAEARK